MASTDRFDGYGRVVRCRGCDLVYTNPRPSPADIAAGYAKAADPDYAAEDSSRSINAHMSLHTLKRFVPGGKLLDIGCATGYFLNAARLDYDVAGVELSHWAVKHAREKLKLDVKQGAFEEAGFPPENFDAVSMNDVIEHLTDPAGFLKRVHGVMKPGAVLYLVTPNIESLSAHVLGGKWWGLRPAHLTYYSPDTLQATLEQAGFDVVFTKSYGRVFTYGYWLSRLKNYPRLVSWTAGALIRGLGIENKFLYLDTRDSLEVCARRR